MQQENDPIVQGEDFGVIYIGPKGRAVGGKDTAGDGRSFHCETSDQESLTIP